jgi:hypothetical protein
LGIIKGENYIILYGLFLCKKYTSINNPVIPYPKLNPEISFSESGVEI